MSFALWVMKTTKVFDMTSTAWLSEPRYISSCGGTRSGKTYSILQLLFFVMLGEAKRGLKPAICSVVSESMPHLKRGCIRDFKTILRAEGIWEEERWSETAHTYTFDNGGIIEFWSVDDSGKVFGSARDYLFINECQHIDYEVFRQLAVRTRTRIIVDYNPTHHFWVQDKVESKDNCKRIHSTYKDNDYLTKEQIREIEGQREDVNFWRVFGLGLEGALDGLVYEFETIDSLPDNDMRQYAEVYGMDFGFTNDPTARVQVLADTGRKVLYVRERCYRTHMLNSDIVEDLQADNVGRGVPIYADCAEPKSIADIKRYGFNVLPCDKNAPVKSDKLKFQIQWLQGWKLKVTKDSINLINELRNYTWAKDKDNNNLSYPIDKYNHALDALRYAAWTRFGKQANHGNYTIR